MSTILIDLYLLVINKGRLCNKDKYYPRFVQIIVGSYL